MDARWTGQIIEYINSNITKDARVELWGITFGNGEHKIEKVSMALNNILDLDFEILLTNACKCIELF